MKSNQMIIVSLILFLCSFSENQNEIKGEWLICGDWITPEKTDSITLIKRNKISDYQICDNNGIAKYSIWSFRKDGSLDLTSYTGFPDLPVASCSNNIAWSAWEIDKSFKIVTLISRNKEKIKFEVEFNDTEVKLKLKKRGKYQ